MFLIGLCLVSFGVAELISSIFFVYLGESSGRYRMQSTLGMEIMLILILVAVIAIAAGVVLMIFGKMKQSSQKQLKAMQNYSSNQYCMNCRINAVPQLANCPICGRALNAGGINNGTNQGMQGR